MPSAPRLSVCSRAGLARLVLATACAAACVPVATAAPVVAPGSSYKLAFITFSDSGLQFTGSFSLTFDGIAERFSFVNPGLGSQAIGLSIAESETALGGGRTRLDFTFSFDGDPLGGASAAIGLEQSDGGNVDDPLDLLSPQQALEARNIVTARNGPNSFATAFNGFADVASIRLPIVTQSVPTPGTLALAVFGLLALSSGRHPLVLRRARRKSTSGPR